MLGASAISAARFGSRSGRSRQGFEAQAAKQGIGLVAMRERAELLGGVVEFVLHARQSGSGNAGSIDEFQERSLIPMPDKISVLLVDDHTLVRRGFRRILEDEPDIKVAGEASDGLEAVKLADELHPKVIVMDCAMPGMNGWKPRGRFLASNPEALVLMLSMHPEETLVRQALEAGARGYVLKNAVDLELGAPSGESPTAKPCSIPNSSARPRSKASATPRSRRANSKSCK
jgi:CheY-like chemotaxis protein